ncbi:MAG TPA: hypothetical protein P5110_06510 [Candidatus Omnitrophota bacterium]|nr:hypothetical protein [Candidatus Omnitrophota bacterium]HRZ15141.1 hypothetical protein [Candidatus Omnitrophota bacterium]
MRKRKSYSPRKIGSCLACACLLIALGAGPACARTTEHHLINMGRDVLNVIASPVKALLIKGPQAVKRMYAYEVYEREKPEDRGLLRYKLFAILSAPAVEVKSLIDGLVESVNYGGKFGKEFLSIPFSD